MVSVWHTVKVLHTEWDLGVQVLGLASIGQGWRVLGFRPWL